jgi:hypothetical protein
VKIISFDVFVSIFVFRPTPVAARYKMLVCGCSLAGIVVSNPAGGLGVLSLVGVVSCQVVLSAPS